MPRFKKRPVVIHATRLSRTMTVETLEGVMKGNPGDWLITGVNGEQYFCKNDIFLKTYSPVDNEAAKLYNIAWKEDNPPQKGEKETK